MRHLLLICFIFYFSILPIYGQLTPLTYPTLSHNGHFGKRLSVFNDYAIVAEPNYSFANIIRTGRVHIFKREGVDWHHQNTLEPAKKFPYAHFGRDVVANDRFLAVSAPTGTGGIVSIFEKKQSDSWTLIQEIEIPEELKKPALHVHFGERIALHGEWLMITAPGYPATDNPLVKTGVVFAYQRQDDKFIFRQLIFPQEETRSIHFGSDIDLTADWFAVTAPKADGGAPNSGVVYLYKQEGDTWNLDYTFINPASRSNELFGHDVAIYNNNIVIGVPMHTRSDDEGPFGAVHVFQRFNDSWISTALLESNDGKRNDMFGFTVEIEGDNIAVAAPRYDNPGIPDLGKVYLFQFEHGFWVQTNSFIPPESDIQSHMQFGSALSIHDEQLIIGGHLMNNIPDDSGIAYEIDLDQSVGTADPESRIPDVKIHPNPGSDFFKLELAKEWGRSAEVTLYSSQGLPVKRHRLEPKDGNSNFQCETRSLSAGIYFIHVTNGAHAFIKKWIKI